MQIGFKLNPYDSCVSKHMANRQQLTILKHFYNLKLSPVDGEKATKFINGVIRNIPLYDGPRF